MIFVIPIILGALAAGTGVVGVLKGTEGINNVRKAEEIGKIAQDKHEKAVKHLEKQWQELNRVAGLYGQLQLRARQRAVTRFVDFIKRQGKKASQSEQEFLDGFEGLPISQFKEFEIVTFQDKEISQSVINATTAGVAAGSTTLGLANAVGTVAVPQFFGLFTKQVAVSQLGLQGAALWLGGGNVLLGGALLGGVSIAPALAIGGFQLAGTGEKSLTQAIEYEAKVNASIRKIETVQETLKRIEERIREVGRLVLKLETRATECLSQLEKDYSSSTIDIIRFQQAALLVKTLIEISKISILDEEGNLSFELLAIKAKYKKLGDLND